MDAKLAYNKSSLTGKPLQRLLKLFAKDKKEIIFIYIYAIFNGLVNLSIPLGTQAIIALIVGREFSSSWGILIFIVVVGVAVTGGLQIMQLSITEILQQRIFTRASFEFAFRIPRFKPEAIQNYYAPELINRFFDVISVQKGLSKILIDLSTAVLQIVFGLLLLTFYHPFFVFFGFFLLLILVMIFAFTGAKGLQTGLKESKFKYAVAHWLEELARTMDTFKLAGPTGLPMEKMNDLVSGYLKSRKQHFNVLLLQYGYIAGFKTIITFGLLFLGSILLVQQEINLGQFVASEIIILLVISAVEKLILTMESVYDVLIGVEKVGNISDIPLEGESGIPFKEVDKGEGGVAVKVKDLSYRYLGAAENTLTDINFDIKPGENICIAGYNDSGKSTLINLVSGLDENFQGVIAYNDVPINNINISSLRAVIGDNLSQEDLFYGTLLENITMGKPEISVSDVMDVINSLRFMDFVQRLPKGLDTMVDPGGKRFASSMVKKILLARSIVKNPKILVLEDFLTNMDLDECQCIIDYLTSKERTWSMLTVTSDALLASRCNRIYVMKEGKIIDEGTYEEIKTKPYFNLVFTNRKV